MARPPLDPQLEVRLRRYLHTGMEVPKYFPGCWKTHKYYELDKLTAINAAVEHDKDNTELVDVIIKAYKDGGFTRYEVFGFALTKMIILGGQKLKTAAYKAVPEICQSPNELLLFAKFTRLYKSVNVLGNGQGWCKAIKSWYNQRTPMELATDITRVKGRHGRDHNTLVLKSHYKVPEDDVARDAVIKYTLFGLKKAKLLVGNKEGTKEILDYIQKVEDVRHCEDPVAAAAMIKQNKFTLDHVPGHLITSQEVWDAILPQFTMAEILNNLQRIHNMGFLTKDSTTTAILKSLFSNKEFIKNSNVTPIHVYITMCNYKKKTRPMKHEKAMVTVEKEQRRRNRQIFDATTGLWEWTVARRHPKEIKVWGIEQPPNQEILASLVDLMDESWLVAPPTGARYMITFDMRHHMFKGRHFCKNYVVRKKGIKPGAAKPPVAASSTNCDGEGDAEKKKGKKKLLAECFYNRHVTPGHAAIIIALQILKREKNVKLAVFTEEGVKVVSVERNFSNMEEAEFVLRNAGVGRVQQDAPIEWAIKNREPVDVFINMVDRTTRYVELDKRARGGRGPGGKFGPPPKLDLADHCPVRALMRYREANRVPEAKLIVMSLASHRVSTTDGSHTGVLDIIGIDEHVPKVMDAFVKGLFK